MECAGAKDGSSIDIPVQINYFLYKHLLKRVSSSQKPHLLAQTRKESPGQAGFHQLKTGRSAAWLAHWSGGPGVGGSNPLSPT